MKRSRARRWRDHEDEAPVWTDFSDFPEYVSVSERRLRAEQAARTLADAGETLTPVRASAKGIATSVWGRAWCRHLEHYSDYASRLPRGRSYLRNGCVLDLSLQRGQIHAKVQGTRLYEIEIRCQELDPEHWSTVRQSCQGSIDSLLDLLQGQLTPAVMQVITDPERGIFPQPHEIRLSCTCPDWADMCKHVAAVLYGVAIRLDTDPAALFLLRGVNHHELLLDAVNKGLEAHDQTSALVDADLGAMFGIDLEDDAILGIDTAQLPAAIKKTPPSAGKKSPKARSAKRSTRSAQPTTKKTRTQSTTMAKRQATNAPETKSMAKNVAFSRAPKKAAGKKRPR